MSRPRLFAPPPPPHLLIPPPSSLPFSSSPPPLHITRDLYFKFFKVITQGLWALLKDHILYLDWQRINSSLGQVSTTCIDNESAFPYGKFSLPEPTKNELFLGTPFSLPELTTDKEWAFLGDPIFSTWIDKEWALLWENFHYLNWQGMGFSLGQIFSTWLDK